MNKRLRRLWRRRRSSRENSALQQNTNERSALSSLLAERSSAKQNYYFRTGNTRHDENELKKGNDNSDDKNILIVEDANDTITKNSSDVEIRLEPMISETATTQTNPTNIKNDCRVFDSIPSTDSVLENHSRISNSESNESTSEKDLITVSNSSNFQSKQIEILSLLTKSSYKNENPYSPLPLIMPVFNEDGEKSSDKEKPKMAQTTSIIVHESNKSTKTNQSLESVTRQSVSSISNLARKRADALTANTERRSPTFEMAVPTFCAGNLLTSNAFVPVSPLPTFEKPMETNSHLMRVPEISCHQSISALPSLPGCSMQTDFSQSHAVVEFPGRSPAPSSSSFRPLPRSHIPFPPSCHQCTNHNHHHHFHYHHHHESSPQSPFWHNHDPQMEHCGRTCNSAFANRQQGCSCCKSHCCSCFAHDSSWNECHFPIKKQFRRHTCSAHRSCSLRSREEEISDLSPPVIEISFPGEANRKTIELDGLNPHEEDSSHMCTSAEGSATQSPHQLQALRASKRHLEEACCADHDLHCERSQQMAPSVTLLSSSQENRRFQSQCRCCHQMLHPLRTSFKDDCKMAPPHHFANHSYLNCDNASNSIQNTLGHFQLSPRSYMKLLAYIESTRAATKRRRSPASPFESRSSFHGFERRSFSPNNELMFLNRKPVHATNEYATFGEQMLNSSNYQNQTIADTLQLAKVLETVEECPWYWGEVSNAEAKQILRGTPIGTFILRDSSDPRFLFSVSVMTSRGPTSIRVVYTDGYFRFDSDGNTTNPSSRKASLSNEFEEIPKHRQCVVHMILHYTAHLASKTQSAQNLSTRTTSDSSASSSSEISETSTDASSSNEQSHFMCSWMGRTGKKVMPVSISLPLTRNTPSSLQQLSRLSINKHLNTWQNHESVQKLPLTPSLQKYLRKYPYPV